MAMKGYCGQGPCDTCEGLCALRTQSPCSPDCKNLTEEGFILAGQCILDGCRGLSRVFGGMKPEEVLEAFGAVTAYAYAQNPMFPPC